MTAVKSKLTKKETAIMEAALSSDKPLSTQIDTSSWIFDAEALAFTSFAAIISLPLVLISKVFDLCSWASVNVMYYLMMHYILYNDPEFREYIRKVIRRFR